MNEKLKNLQATFLSLSNDIKPLVEKNNGAGLSDEEGTKFDDLIAQLNKCGEDITTEQKRYTASQAAAGQIADATKPAAGQRELVNDAKARDQQFARSLGQRFAESQQVQDFVKLGSKKSQPFAGGSFYHRGSQPVEHFADMGPTDLRTLIGSAALPADFVRPDLLAGIYRGDMPTNDLRSVLINGTTSSDAITFIRENVYTNAAAGVPEATHTSAADETPVNASVKPESALTFEQVTAPVVTIAHWIPITRQTLQDASQLQAYVENRLVEGLKLEESDQLINGAGGNDLTGFLATTGIQDLDTAVYFAGAAVNDAGQDNENFNRILRARRLVRTTGRAQANFVVLNPADYEEMITFTDAERQYFGAGPFGNAAVTSLWGMRVIEDEAMTVNHALVGDGRMAAVWDRMQAQIFIDTVDDQFIRNMLTILAEERVALTVFRPAAFADVELI